MDQPLETGKNLEVLLDEKRIARRVRELGAQISADYRGRELHLIGILKGAWVFLADLVRHLEVEVTLDFMSIQTYGSSTNSSGDVKITKDLDVSIQDRDVLVVEDILDTGRTFRFLQEVLLAHNPRTLKVVALLDKTSRRVVSVRADYVGFPIPDVFVVGYGLDYSQKYRELRDVRVLRSVPSL